MSGVVDPCHFCKEMKTMHPDCAIDCTGWSGMDMLKFIYFRENPMGMTHAHTHSAVIMNCNDREANKYLMDEVFSITYIDRAMIVKNYVDNELIKYHPQLAPIICLAVQILLALRFEERRKIYTDGLAMLPEQGGHRPGGI